MSGLKYTEDHECIKVEGDIAWVGITKYAYDALGDIVFIELPDIGKTVKKGEDVAVVESVKVAAEVYSPVDGEVVEANSRITDAFEFLSHPVAEDGWIAKIRLSDASQLDGFMDKDEYDAYLESLK